MKTFVFAITLASAAAMVAQQTPSQASKPSGQPTQQPTQSQTTSPNPQTLPEQSPQTLPDQSPQTLPKQSPQTTPNQSQTTPSQQMPRDNQSPTAMNDSSHASSSQIQQQVQQGWQSQSALSNSKLNAQVSGSTLTLDGTVSSEAEHQQALQVANQNANGLQVVDNIKVQPK